MSADALQIAIHKLKGSDLEGAVQAMERQGYQAQQLKADNSEGFKLRMFHIHFPGKPKWKGFTASIARAGEPVLKTEQSWSEGFVLLLQNEATNAVYAVAGGVGFLPIQQLHDPDFGIDVFARMLKKEDKIVKATREKGVIGGVLGSSRHFRRDSNLNELDSFGKIYQELKASVRRDILVDKMGFDLEDLKRDAVCVVKSSFRINKAIDLPALTRIIKGCEEILANEEPVAINSVDKLSRKKNAALVARLETELFNQLWETFSEEVDAYQFDLCAYDFESYLTATEYLVQKGSSSKTLNFHELQDINTLFEGIKSSPTPPTTKEEFVKQMDALVIFALDGEGATLTKGELFEHLMGDITLEGKKYFLIDGTWFQIKDTFTSELNRLCREQTTRHPHTMEERWNFANDSENKFNAQHFGKARMLVLDKVLVENIETCDVLGWNDTELHLIHVKKGYGNTMRDLCSQISISARRLTQDRSASNEFAKKLYAAIKSKAGSGDFYFEKVASQADTISLDDFVSMFATKKLVFVLAVLDNAREGDRDIKTPEIFSSNIAKFSICDLVKSTRALDIELRIAQIYRAD